MFEKSQFHDRYNPNEFAQLQMLMYSNPAKVLCFDIETTGFDAPYDEVLQFTAVDGYGRLVYNEFFKPTHKEVWDDAAKINGITPDKVADKDSFYKHVGEISTLLAKYPILVGYNHTNRDRSPEILSNKWERGFDAYFLEQSYVELPQSVRIKTKGDSNRHIYHADGSDSLADSTKPAAVYVDVMREYGCYIDPKSGRDRYFKLTMAADKEGIPEDKFLDGLQAHDSRGDVLLTMGVLYKIFAKTPLALNVPVPKIPEDANPKIKGLIEDCYKREPNKVKKTNVETPVIDPESIHNGDITRTVGV